MVETEKFESDDETGTGEPPMVLGSHNAIPLQDWNWTFELFKFLSIFRCCAFGVHVISNTN